MDYIRSAATNNQGDRHQGSMTIDSGDPYSMTDAELRDRLNRQDTGTLHPQLLAGFIACLSALTFGSCLGGSSPVITQLKHRHINLTWYPSLVALGAAVGVIPGSYAMETFGPRKVLLVLEPFYIACWLVIIIPGAQPLLAVLRFFKGLLGMCHKICGETLLVETVHHALVCKMYVAFQSSIYLGVSLCQLVGFNMKLRNLAIMFSMVPILHWILLYLIPESPVCLMRHNETLAERALAWYRGSHNIHDDMRLIRRDAEVFRLDVETYRYMIYSKVVMKGLLIIIAVELFRLLTGYYIFLMYSGGHILFGGKVVEPLVLMQVTAVFFYVSNVISVTLHVTYEMPVRPPLILSCFGASFCLMITAIGMYYAEKFYNYAIWVPPLLEFALIFCTDMGLNYMPKVMLIEYMPIQMYKMAERYSTVLHWLGAFVLLRVFESARAPEKLGRFFICLSCFCCLGGVFCYFFVVESKGKSLMRVQLDIGGNPVGNRAAHIKRYQLSKQRNTSAVTHI